MTVHISPVIEMLDSMKKGKENYAVRDTIKFLERELKSGNKYVIYLTSLVTLLGITIVDFFMHRSQKKHFILLKNHPNRICLVGKLAVMVVKFECDCCILGSSIHYWTVLYTSTINSNRLRLTKPET